MSVKRPTRRDDHARHIIGAARYAWFASIRKEGADFGGKRRPIKKIERDDDNVLSGGRFFFFKATTNQKMAFAMEGGIGEGAGPRWNPWVGRCIIVWGDGMSDKKN